jgi:NADH:ubiquinone oxidoreductase subunit F (NADH-binding)
LVNNVETLANVPWIVRHGADVYSALGFSRSRGTKVVCLNSLFERPGMYEVEFGIPLRRIVEDLGGGLRGGAELRGVIIGGPLAGIVPPQLLDTPFGFEELRAIGASVGHGGVVAFDARTSLPELVHHVFRFAAFESCGHCFPCRLGCRRVEQLFDRVADAPRAGASDRQEWIDLVEMLSDTSLCGLGSGAAEFAQSVLKYYPREVESCFA